MFSCDSGSTTAVEIEGCTDESACNYDETAINDDGTCAAYDECGVCGGDGIISAYVEECNWEYICDYVNVSLGSDSYCTNSCINGTYCTGASDCFVNNGFAGSCNNGATCVMWVQELQCSNQYICESQYITECP
tara:strand:+ start:1512 stop:1913 length:402 start_codon:yes stop_codon:yes gene_type:complete